MSSINWNKILAVVIAIAFLLPGLAESQRPKRKAASSAVAKNGDSTKVGTAKRDAIKMDTAKVDSLSLDSLSSKKKKTQLNAPVQYSADDSIVFTHDGYAHLYGNGKVSYQKTELAAQVISMNMDSSTVFATGV